MLRYGGYLKSLSLYEVHVTDRFHNLDYLIVDEFHACGTPWFGLWGG